VTSLNSIDKRLSDLERTENKAIHFIFVEYEGARPEETTKYLYDKCKSSCEPDIFARLLDETTTLRNNIRVITIESMAEMVRKLKEEWISIESSTRTQKPHSAM
jgi:hypothetical protein